MANLLSMFGLSKDIGIDLGTANTLIFMKGKGVIMREPSVVAVDTRRNTVSHVGHDATEVIGRTPSSIVAVRPLKDGVIADFDIAANMLQIFIKKACNNSPLARPRTIICVPSGVTEVERRAVKSAAIKGGARQVSIIEEPMAAAIGADLPAAEATGSMAVDIGGGTRGGRYLPRRHCGRPQRAGGGRRLRHGHNPLCAAQIFAADRRAHRRAD